MLAGGVLTALLLICRTADNSTGRSREKWGSGRAPAGSVCGYDRLELRGSCISRAQIWPPLSFRTSEISFKTWSTGQSINQDNIYHLKITASSSTLPCNPPTPCRDSCSLFVVLKCCFAHHQQLLGWRGWEHQGSRFNQAQHIQHKTRAQGGGGREVITLSSKLFLQEIIKLQRAVMRAGAGRAL